jgi:taurine dioxygenase
LALETLPHALRQQIDTVTVKNDTTYTAGAQLRSCFSPVTDVRLFPGATHPLVRTHPETQCNALYLGRRRNGYIHGLSMSESEALLDRPWTHVAQPSLFWWYQWQVGDVVIWDNRCVLHRRESFDGASLSVTYHAHTRDELLPARHQCANAAHSRSASLS